MKTAWIEVACELCGSETCELLYQLGTGPDRSRFVRCLVCGLVRLSPRPARSDIGDYYTHDYGAHQLPGAGSNTIAARGHRLLQGLVLVNRYGWPAAGGVKADSRLAWSWPCRSIARLVSPRLGKAVPHAGQRRLLDVGCGSGEFLSWMLRMDSSWRVMGIDPSQRAVDCARSVGLDVRRGSPTELDRLCSFDVITLWNVIEHTYDPVGVMRHLRSLLSAEGVLVLITPNVDSVSAGLFRSNWWHLAPPVHLNLFSVATLGLLSQTAGFAPPKIEERAGLDLALSIRVAMRTARSAKIRRLLGAALPAASIVEKLRLGSGEFLRATLRTGG